MSVDSKEIQKYIISIIKKQDWLDCRKHQEALDNLCKECSDEEEMRTLLELVSRFTEVDPIVRTG